MNKNWIYGDNVDTDVIIPARYLNTQNPKELALHCMEDIDKTFSSSVKEGDFIIAGNNFGCGSSREHAPLAIKSCAVKAVIAKTFARIFYRNAINIGLVIMKFQSTYLVEKYIIKQKRKNIFLNLIQVKFKN